MPPIIQGHTISPMRSRVVITGLGPVCANAVGVEAFWESLLADTAAITPIEAFDASGYRSKLAGEVREVKIRDFVPKSYRKATKVMARDTELAVIAAKLAANDAGLSTRGSEETDQGFAIDSARTGCQIGAGLIAADTEELSRAIVSAKDDQDAFSMEKWGTEGSGEAGMNNLPPLWLLKYLPNMLACHVTIIHGLEGPSNTIMGAESSAILSIGESTRVIERGSADMCFSGGAESRLNPLGLLRWEYSGRIAPTNDSTDGSDITKPFDPESLGGLIGEAGGMVILEDQAHAESRDAKIYAQIAGFGAAQSPPPVFPDVISARADGQSNPTSDLGLEAAIESALLDAQLTAEDIDLIIPLGLGVPELDRLELGALYNTFKDAFQNTPLISIARLVGNTLAGHGGLMTALGALCLQNQQIPNAVYAHMQAEKSTLEPCPSGKRSINHVLVCSGSLGGQTGALILKRYNASA